MAKYIIRSSRSEKSPTVGFNPFTSSLVSAITFSLLYLFKPCILLGQFDKWGFFYFIARIVEHIAQTNSFRSNVGVHGDFTLFVLVA